MLETQTQEKEFVNGNIPLVSVSVEDKVASVFLQGWQNENDTSGLFSQDEIREFISLLLEAELNFLLNAGASSSEYTDCSYKPQSIKHILDFARFSAIETP